MYAEDSIKQYLDDLSARLPAPGGGSAAALAASLGASLISMVANFTLGKPKYAKYESEIEAVLGKSEELRQEFLKLVDLDVTAYKSKDLKEALNVPLMVCRLCLEAIRLCPPLIKKGNVNLISDVAVAAVLLESGFASAKFNVEINLKYMKGKEDNKLIRNLEKEIKCSEKIIKKTRLETEEKVGKTIRG
ncbi:MAG: hypothetical protein DRP74_01285 [Candidatus Omnitrophota bacterium]|nr:MAG: hypothetical protein DRP74_01285 [Candidatus Omnitrophota bacterium]